METAIGFLITAWFLQLFGFGDICVQSLNELFGLNITLATYYFASFTIGLVVELFRIY